MLTANAKRRSNLLLIPKSKPRLKQDRDKLPVFLKIMLQCNNAYQH